MTDDQSGTESQAERYLGKEIVWTPEFERVGVQVGRWIAMEMPGASMYGVQRTGKSAALLRLANTISDFTGTPVFVSICTCSRTMKKDPSALNAEWLLQLNIPGSSARAETLLANYFLEGAKELKTDQVMLIIDESQDMRREHLFKLLHWGNFLTLSRKLRVFTLLCGQPDLLSVIEGYANMDEAHLLGRYHSRKIEFQGIHPSDIGVVVEGHETEVVCLDGTTAPPRVAEHFPEAWAKGWRPSRWTPVITEGFAMMAAKCHLPRDQRIPMGYLRAVLVSLVLKAKTLDNPLFDATPEDVVNALIEVGLNNSWTKYASVRRKAA